MAHLCRIPRTLIIMMTTDCMGRRCRWRTSGGDDVCINEARRKGHEKNSRNFLYSQLEYAVKPNVRARLRRIRGFLSSFQTLRSVCARRTDSVEAKWISGLLSEVLRRKGAELLHQGPICWLQHARFNARKFNLHREGFQIGKQNQHPFSSSWVNQ